MRVWTERELYLACKRDGHQEQREAFEALHRELYPIAYYMVANTHHPDPQSVAMDCAQEATIKVWHKLHTCQEPDKFRNWAKRIVRNHTLNEIARFKKALDEPLEKGETQPDTHPYVLPEQMVDEKERYSTLVNLIAQAPLSERSRRVVVGKYLQSKTEDELCRELSKAENKEVRPSHVQVTRAKNFRKIQQDPVLLEHFRELVV